MNIEINSASINAALRHVYTATATGIAVLAIVGMSQGDQTALGTAVHQIGDGLASIVAGVTTIIPIVSALFASKSAGKVNQAASIAQTDGLKVIPTSFAGQKILDAMPAAAKAANQ